jgi:hypothetical protein
MIELIWLLLVIAPRSRQLQQALSAPDTTQEQKDKLAAKFETRRARLVSQFAQWCRAIVSNPDFYLLKPVVEQVHMWQLYRAGIWGTSTRYNLVGSHGAVVHSKA